MRRKKEEWIVILDSIQLVMTIIRYLFLLSIPFSFFVGVSLEIKKKQREINGNFMFLRLFCCHFRALAIGSM